LGNQGRKSKIKQGEGEKLFNRQFPVLKLFPALCLILAIAVCTGQKTKINDGYGDYVLVPAGEFEMGDIFDEGHSDEIPVHTVYLDAYFIGKYKVTNQEFEKFIEDNGYKNPDYWISGGFGQYGPIPEHWNEEKYKGGGIPGNEDYPVVGISWFEAMAYCRWLSEKTGNTYRLPTEAEWEKAARGTGKRRYAWGNAIDETYTNYDSGKKREEMSLTPVGFYDGGIRNGKKNHSNASPYGAFDMTGSTSEWCLDWYGRDYYSVSPSRNPQGPDTGQSRVMRSAGYIDSAYYQRTASRHKRGAHAKSFASGFRCVREFEGVRKNQ
jgi:formylglycine-generating enzyme required for sulfatase activity